MKNTESGRSMVEMLGVLAIIGVLSVGGIAGYTMAMRKYKANEAINVLLTASIMCQSGQTIDANSLDRTGIITDVACNNSEAGEGGVQGTLDNSVSTSSIADSLDGYKYRNADGQTVYINTLC
ncbi:MAG: hypothetical protein II938_03135 [Alphaproteobacteria bacterium]|nr:hypothetical protein [Alphaproteobacteria bacterium]